MTTVIGVDGWRGGWVGAVVHVEEPRGARFSRWLLTDDAAALLASDADAVGLDIPIGLPDSGRRACDVAVRRHLGSASRSVFPAPVRAVLPCLSYEGACRVARVVDEGRALPLQAWNLVPKIADVDRVMSPAQEDRVVEVHPELAFRVMQPPVQAPKRTPRGAGQRLRALAPWVDAAAALSSLPAGPRLDDAVDALAVAWSAARWATGRALVLPPGEPPRDSRGLAMRIAA